MRWKNGLIIGGAILALLAGAAVFQRFAPENYGEPEIEIVDPGPSGVRIAADGLFGNFYPATGEGPHAGVLMLGGSEGGLGGGATQMARELQREGFAVFHLAYFGAPGTADALEQIPLELFDRGLDWLGAQPGVDPERLAVVGASKGAEAALLVATRRPDLRAVVAGMPSSVVWNGINWARGGQSMKASWSAHGEALPTMPYAAWNPREGIISVYRSIEKIDDDPALRAAAERAAIAIERATAPAMLVCGEAETMWPACPMARQVEARARERGGPPVEILAYPDAGHVVFGPPVPPESAFYPRLAMFGGTVEGNAQARIDGWPQVVAFLKRETEPRESGDL